jgi:glutamate synthase domain-containing protein 2
VAAATWANPWLVWLGLPVLLLGGVGVHDALQTRHTLLRNFPVLGRLRFLAESLRPELRQYFVESDSEENPLSREKRSIVYQRAKGMLDTQPFGTHRPIYATGYEWIGHSIAPVKPPRSAARVLIGQPRCAAPYDASRFNISAMSFGALSGAAILAMNEGARRGGFYQNTGEGGVSRYHLDRGGDLVWQIGTGYFGCRTEDGRFDPDAFERTAAADAIKMIELKLSQGAKPSHGGILPAQKVTHEIARARGVPVGRTVVSPPAHTAFEGPTGLLELLTELRRRAGGKPVGFKLCVGNPLEVMALVKAMHETGSRPDFITVDGAEGGTGAAPLELSNSVGMPLDDGLVFVDNALRGAGLRDQVRIVSAGKLTTGFHMLRQLALGADLCNAARAMMLAVGCVQALECNTNECPTGVATQDPRRTRGLVVADKAARVASFHRRTVDSFLELLGAAGLKDPDVLRPHHVFRRISPMDIHHLGQVFRRVEPGSLLEGEGSEPYQSLWDQARADVFSPEGGAARFGTLAS